MRRWLLPLLLLLTWSGLAQAAAVTLNWDWVPNPLNTVMAEQFTAQRQPKGGAFADVCTVAGTARTCVDASVPPGEYCWKVVARAGTVTSDPSNLACLDLQQFRGSITVILSVQP